MPLDHDPTVSHSYLAQIAPLIDAELDGYGEPLTWTYSNTLLPSGPSQLSVIGVFVVIGSSIELGRSLAHAMPIQDLTALTRPEAVAKIVLECVNSIRAQRSQMIANPETVATRAPSGLLLPSLA